MTSAVIKGFLKASLAVSAAAMAVAFAQPAMAEPEFQRETDALVAATAALFDDVEAEHVAGSGPANRLQIRVLNRLIPVSAKPMSPYADVFPVERGPVDHLTGYQITWYPLDRLLGTVDFMGTYGRNRNLVCGYLTWDLTDPSAPALEQITATYVDLGLLSGRNPGAIHAALLEANCAFGEIEPNFAVFEPVR